MNARQLDALRAPTSGLPAEIAARRQVTLAGDGALITVVLAVDR